MTTKLTPETALERNVAKWAKSLAPDYNSGIEGVFKDLFYGGCQSGMVGHLIYYCDTIKFFKKHRREISAILAEYIEDGVLESMADLNGWDKEDPLALDTNNQNLLAWFGFEEAARRLCDRAGLEV